MKSTYKLLGVEWDHKALPQEIPRFKYAENVQLCFEEKNIFDLDSYNRQISVSEILTMDSIERLDVLLDRLKECDSIFLNIDYEPNTPVIDILAFYVLRVLQIYAYTIGKLPGVSIFLMCSDNMKNTIIDYWENKMKSLES